MRRLCVDDLRILDLEDVKYARSLELGLHLALTQPWDELYLDHDLGAMQDIKPLVLALEERAFNEDPAPIGKVFIITGNPVAQQWMFRALRLGYDVEVIPFVRCQNLLTLVESIDAADEERSAL